MPFGDSIGFRDQLVGGVKDALFCFMWAAVEARVTLYQGKRLSDYPTTIGEAIRKRRRDLGIRQVDAAISIGCNEMTVVNWEKGHTKPQSK